VGSNGCCDPARPWQFFQTGSSKKALGANSTKTAKHAHAAADFTEVDAGTNVAYALFNVAGLFKDGLSAQTIDLSSGKVTARKTVSGPVQEYINTLAGASTRLFAWDAANTRFVFADADYSGKGPAYPLTVYTIDATTGASTSKPVSGCAGEPLGMTWDADAKGLVLGMQDKDSASFFLVNPDTGKATPAGTVSRGSSESSPSYYAAYISYAGAGKAYRVGHEQVSSGTGPGMSTLSLSASSQAVAVPQWQDVALSKNHSLPVTVRAHPFGGFVSLAIRGSTVGLDVVTWDATNGTARVIANLTNANVPFSAGAPKAGIPNEGACGYVGEDVAGTTFAAMTMQEGGKVPIISDKWKISTVDLNTGAVYEAALSPQPSIAGGDLTSLAGFGMPSTTAAEKESEKIIV